MTINVKEVLSKFVIDDKTVYLNESDNIKLSFEEIKNQVINILTNEQK